MPRPSQERRDQARYWPHLVDRDEPGAQDGASRRWRTHTWPLGVGASRMSGQRHPRSARRLGPPRHSSCWAPWPAPHARSFFATYKRRNGDLGRVPPVRFMDRNPDTEDPRPVHVRARGRVVAKLHGCCEDERVEDSIVPVPQAVRTESRCVESEVAADLTAFAVASWLAATLDDIHVELRCRPRHGLPPGNEIPSSSPVFAASEVGAGARSASSSRWTRSATSAVRRASAARVGTSSAWGEEWRRQCSSIWRSRLAPRSSSALRIACDSARCWPLLVSRIA